ncbi:MAG: hypothetical protein WDM90_01970 [Ferruginibacter sp.]
MIIEQEYFKFITRGTPIKANGNNCIYYTETHEYYSNEAFRNFSIKIPLQGLVYYKTHNREFELAANNFLLSYKQPGKVVIDASSLVKAMCIDINQETIVEAFNVIGINKEYDLENFEAGYFFTPDFFENTYSLNKNDFGSILNKLSSDILNSNLEITEETFLSLAQETIIHELGNYKSLVLK